MGFLWNERLGARLKTLRKRAGLSLRRLALLMGRDKKGAWNILSRLETGRMKNPPLGLVVDYLRACGADLRAILDLIPDEGGPPAPRSLPEKPEHRRTPEEEMRRRTAEYIRRVLRADVEEGLYAVLKQLGEPVARTSLCANLCALGRRWFEILWRTRDRPRSRERQLQKERARTIPEGLKPEWVALVRQQMEVLAAERIKNPPLPPPEPNAPLPAPPARADVRFLTERLAHITRSERLRRYRLAGFSVEIVEWLKRQGTPWRHLNALTGTLFPQMMLICEGTEGNPEERRRRLAEAVRPWLNSPELEKMVEMFIRGYERWKNWTPGDI